MWKKLVTTARFALCQHFTNCSQQSHTTNFSADSTKRNLKSREDLDVLTKLWTILQHTDCWNRNAESGASMGRDGGLHEGIWLDKSPVSLWKTVDRITERWCGKLPKIKDMGTRGQGIRNLAALQTCGLLTTRSCSLLRWCSSKNWCATSSRRKLWATKVRTKEKKWRSGWECEISWANNYISATGNSRDQKIESERLGLRSADTNKSWHHDRTSYNTDSAYSTWLVITPTLSYASCSWTLSKEHERTTRSTQLKMLRSIVQTKRKYKKKTHPAGTMMTTKTRNQTTEAQMKKLQKVPVQTHVATKTATFPSWMTPTKRLRQAKLKKKIGLNTWKEAQL